MAKQRSKQYTKSVFRLNVSYLNQELFGIFPILGKDAKRDKNVSPKLDALKRQILQLIFRNQNHRGLRNYTVAWQTHQGTGTAHLDILLVYQTPVKKSRSSFNYLLPLCPQDLHHFSDRQGKISQVHVTGYSRTQLSKAILQYGQKEDPAPLSNFSPEDSTWYLIRAAIKKDPYGYLSDRMKEDPYNFRVSRYVERYNLDKWIPGWSAIKCKLNDIQQARLGRLQQQRPGLKFISRELIEERLTPEELRIFDEHPCFQIIVDHLNQIPLYGSRRPHKTRNLLITGPTDIGKTSLLQGQSTSLDRFVGSYSVKLQNKYLNQYQNDCYGFINWNQWKYSDFSPAWVLQFLEGCKVSIPMRYNSCIKTDNPLIIMTSNLTLDQHLVLRFGDRPHLLAMARGNLGVRITNVVVPCDMTFMQKLFVVPDPLTNPFSGLPIPVPSPDGGFD